VSIIQRFVISITAILIALIIIFPPWVQTFQKRGISKQRTPIARNNSIFNPPSIIEDSPLYGIEIDKDRLYLKIFLVIILGSACYFITSNVQIPEIRVFKKIKRFEAIREENHLPTKSFKYITIFIVIFVIIVFQIAMTLHIYKKLDEMESIIQILTSIK